MSIWIFFGTPLSFDVSFRLVDNADKVRGSWPVEDRIGQGERAEEHRAKALRAVAKLVHDMTVTPRRVIKRFKVISGMR